MPSSNAVAATTAHVQRLIAQGNTTPQTPAQYAAAAGYTGSAASSVRKHIARQHGQGAQRTGHGRYPAVTPTQMLALLRGGVLASAPTATPAVRKQAAAQAKRTLWAKRQAASNAGAKQAKQAAQASPAQVPAK